VWRPDSRDFLKRYRKKARSYENCPGIRRGNQELNSGESLRDVPAHGARNRMSHAEKGGGERRLRKERGPPQNFTGSTLSRGGQTVLSAFWRIKNPDNRRGDAGRGFG